MKYCLTVILSLLACSAFAFDDAYTTKFPSDRHVPEYAGQVNDKVYVSTPNRPVMVVFVEKKQPAIVEKTQDEIIVKTQWCNDGGCTEWKEQ